MGCCCSARKGSEEDEIYSYFNKLLKENEINFNIKNYALKYSNLSKISGNNFKKLSKKQNVRNRFIKLIQKEGRNLAIIKTNEDLQKMLYYIVILTLLLENKISEDLSNNNNNNINKIEENDLASLQRDLLAYGYNLLNNGINNNIINKYIMYYLAKMFYLCFKGFNDANNYVCIKTYISKIKVILDSNCLEDDEEYYIFVRDNILSLGEFFNSNELFIISDEEIINNLIELFSSILYHHYEYFTNNFSLIKENINKNVRNTTNKLMNFNININNKDNILPNMTQTFDIINSININVEKHYKDVKDINLIIESLYYFLNISSQDINTGKKLLAIFGNKLKEKNDENHDNKCYDIILLLIFYECCIKDDEKLTLSLLEYMTELFLSNDSNNEINANDIYYDITLDSYYMIYKKDTLSKQYVSLLSQIFMKEVENNNQNSFIISQLIQIYHKKENMMNKLIKLFFYFLLYISLNYKEKMNYINNLENNNPKDINKAINIIHNILINLNSIIKTHFINNNGISTLINNNIIGSSSFKMTYIINDNKNNNVKINVTDYVFIIQNFFNFHDLKNEKLCSIEFYLYFHSFIMKNMDVTELIYDFTKREKLYTNLFKIITKFEIILIQKVEQENNIILINKEDTNDNEYYINGIIMTIQILLNTIEIGDTQNYIQDCFILYKSIDKNIQSLLQMQKQNENGNNEINSFNLKIIYSIIFFILKQFIRLINIPNSIEKINKDILDCIQKINHRCGKYLSSIQITKFLIYNNIIEPNMHYLKDILQQNENTDSFFINYNILKQILDIIYLKLFGKSTSLYIFFDNQILNSKYFYNMEKTSVNKSISKGSDNITEPKDNSLINQYDNNFNENYIDDISIQIIEQKNKQKNNLNEIDNIYMSHESKLNIPCYENNINTISGERLLNNSLTNDENPYENLKV